MKKRIILCVTCIAVITVYADAQNKPTIVTESYVVAPPPPPVPPVPPVAPVPPTDAIDLPLPPPPPPAPPVPPTEEYVYNTDAVSVEIINNNGNEISVHTINGKSMVIVKKNGKKQVIKLSTWMANKKYYEKKYGQLPPPPPPLPGVTEEAVFTAPVIVRDTQ